MAGIMDNLPNTHYIPSFFEVTKSGREVILSQFRELYPDTFAGYEPAINAFFVTTNDNEAIKALLGFFQSQINLFQSGKVGSTPGSPRMLPLSHTTYNRDADSVPSTTQLSKLDANLLIDLDEDSEESSTESSLSDEGSTYWIPKAGGIHVLQRDLANAIAEQTGCILCPEPEYKRVRLISGNIQAALAKLQQLEPLLSLMARQGATPVQRVDHNLLSLSCENKGTAVLYVPTLGGSHVERIMVDTKLEDRVESMLIGEEQIYNEITGKYSRAENLNAIHTKDELAVGSKIWANYKMEGFGNFQNSVPQASSCDASVVSSVDHLRPNENMGLVEQARVHEWTKTIDVRADPSQPVSNPALSEIAAQGPTSARVVAKSDNDNDEAPLVEETTRRTIAQDSDDDEAFTEETTRRVIAQDSDDEVLAYALTPTQNSARRSTQESQPQNGTRDGQTASGKRARQADRYQADVPTYRGGPLHKPLAGTVSANAFFADVPRDKDAQGEARFRNSSPTGNQLADHDLKREQRHPPQTAQTKQTRRFGFDGAVDEPDQEQPNSPGSAYEENGQVFVRNASTHNQTLSRESMGQYKSGPGFDPRSYGADRLNARSNNSRRYATQPNTFSSNSNHSQPVSTWPRAPVSTDMSLAYRRRDDSVTQHRRGQNQLIDYADDENRHPVGVQPPPGLSPSRRSHDPDGLQHFHLLDAPLDNIQKPAIKPAWNDLPTPVYDETSVSTSISSGNHPSVLDYNVQTKINKPDIGYIRNDMVSKLRDLQMRKKPTKMTATIPQQPSERIDPRDEATTRKFYKTMNLKAPNAGKGKKGKSGSKPAANNETAAQKAERIARTKAELGLAPVPIRKTQTLTQKAAPEKLTRKAQQVAKSNPRMGQLHADSLQDTSRKSLAREVSERMEAPFELARMFPGNLEFEFQIGQLLTMPTSKIKPNHALEIEKWKSVFDNGVHSAEVFFTNLLTCSGSDADGILDARAEGSKMWNKDIPGRCAVVLGFDCQDSSGSEFMIHLNLDGTHTVSKTSFVLQQVGLQCPGRTWDTCAVLKGTPVWHDIPQALQKSTAELIASVHVRSGSSIDVYFKTPSDNSLTVREVVATKISQHDSQLLDEEDLQLKIVEHKTLYMTGHKKDRRLTRCTEKEHGIMSQEDRVHYEVSIVDRLINATFEENRTLQPGDLMSKVSSRLFDFSRAHSITRAALRLVDKIDWVGGYNIGTIVQRQFVRVKKEEEAARSMPPSMMGYNFMRPVHNYSGMTVTGPRSAVGARTVVGSTVSGMAPVSVHGIRSGTSAQVVTDGRGNYFRLGIGGAHIPMSLQEESSLIGDGLLPDDSASQVGAMRRQSLRRIDERPEGFW